MRIRWGRVLLALVGLLVLVFDSWLIVSWIDALAHQMSGSTSGWNAFPLIMQWLGH